MDVALRQIEEGAELECVNGQITLDEGLETAAFLSLCGGSDDDSGLDGDKPRQWWGNLLETDPARHLRSQFQFLLNTIPLTPANLGRFEDAAIADLTWMLDSGLASFVGASASMPERNTVKVATKIEIQNRVFEPAFLFRQSNQ